MIVAASLAAPAHAQLAFTLRECLEDRNEDDKVHICSIMSGTDEEKARGAIEASQILRARREYDAAVDLLSSKGSSALLDAELGHVWFEQGDPIMADFHFEMALERGYLPDDQTGQRMSVAAQMYADELQYSARNFPAAVKAYARALTLDPDHLPALLGGAEALQKLDRHQEALVDLDKAIRDGSDWTAYLLRARSRQFLGDVEGATADYQQVLAENPEHAGARQALDEIASQP